VKLETVLARLLAIGTVVATLAIAAGLCGVPHLLVAGIGCMIALPAARVAVMFVAFAWARDRNIAAVALLVLAILALGLYVGTLGGTPGG
jgi:uncharacterized membrane protein